MDLRAVDYSRSYIGCRGGSCIGNRLGGLGPPKRTGEADLVGRQR